MAIVAVLDTIYILSSLFTLMWLLFKRMRKLSGLLADYQKGVRKVSAKRRWDKNRFDQMMDVFGGLESPDVRLLMDLFSETRGVEAAIRILTILDEEFLEAWQVKGIRTKESTFLMGLHETLVEFRGAPIGHYLEKISHQKKLMYIANIKGSTDKKHLQAFFHSFTNPETYHSSVEVGNEQFTDKNSSGYVARFSGLKPGQVYTVVISTMYKGKEIAEAVYELKCKPAAPRQLLESSWNFTVKNDDIAFKLLLRWDASSQDKRAYVVDIIRDETSMLDAQDVLFVPEFGHVFEPDFFDETEEVMAEIKVRVWSVDPDDISCRSECPIEVKIPPLPQQMKDYARYLKTRITAESYTQSLTGYCFNVALLKHLSKELNDIHKDLTKAALADDVDIILNNARALTEDPKVEI